jgi:hypothetical protein
MSDWLEMIDKQSRIDAGSGDPNKKQSFNHSPASSFNLTALPSKILYHRLHKPPTLENTQPLSSELPFNFSSTWASSLGRTFHRRLALSGFLRLVPNFPALSSGHSFPVLTASSFRLLCHRLLILIQMVRGPPSLPSRPRLHRQDPAAAAGAAVGAIFPVRLGTALGDIEEGLA